jgi:leader peptidase (prepilin peptidase) / N-methyltransferase
MISDIFLFPDVFWIRFVAGIINGAVLGSFAGVLAYRLPRHLSIVSPRSHCLSCNRILGVRDLVPILSWLATRGRCRTCGAKIGVQCLVIEIITSLACAAATVALGFSFWLIVAYAGIIATVAALSCAVQS